MAKREPRPLRRNFAAGGVVFRSNNQVEWLITQERGSRGLRRDVWRLPKGWLDDAGRAGVPGPLTLGARKATEKELQKAALREVAEEGGVEAEILTKVRTARYFSFMVVAGSSVREKVLKFATFYLMKWKRDLTEGPDWETAAVEWLPFEVAYKRLAFSHEKEILAKAKELLERGK